MSKDFLTYLNDLDRIKDAIVERVVDIQQTNPPKAEKLLKDIRNITKQFAIFYTNVCGLEIKGLSFETD